MLTFTPSDGHSPAIIVASGPVSLDEIEKTVRSMVRLNRESGVICDMQKAELGTIVCWDIKDVAELVSKALPNEDSYRVAIVGRSVLHYGLFRVFLTYAGFSQLKREYQYFEDPNEANKWVATRPSLKANGPSDQSENSAALSA